MEKRKLLKRSIRHIKSSLTKPLNAATMSREGFQTPAVKVKGLAVKIPLMGRHIVKIAPTASKVNLTTIIEGINVRRAGRIVISDSNLCMISIELNKQISKEISHKQTDKSMRDSLERICKGQLKVRPKKSDSIPKLPRGNRKSCENNTNNRNIDGNNRKNSTSEITETILVTI